MNSKLYCINPNTKEYEEVKTICGINIEEILDLIKDYKMSKDLKFDKFGKLEEIQRLKEEYVILQNASDKVEEEKDEEIERLNNIIEKTESMLKRLMEEQEYCYKKYPENWKERTGVSNTWLTSRDCYWSALNYLKKLKGSDKE